MNRLPLTLLLLSCTSAATLAADSSQDYADGLALFSWAEYRFPELFPSANTETLNIEGYVVRHYQDSDNYLGLREGMIYGFGTAFAEFEDVGNGVRHIGAYSDLADSLAANGFKSSTGPVLVVSEAVAKDADGGPDWFELYAAGTEAVSLSQYSVRDGNEERELSPLPNVSLLPGQYLRITASDADEYASDPYHVPFKLGSNDRVELHHNGVLVDDLDWDDGEAPAGYSFGRYPGPYSAGMILVPTPGAANQPAQTGVLAISSLGAVGPMLSSEPHALSVTLDTVAYQSMIATYNSTGEKTWLDVSITLDGETYEHVGMRLKGNSSLRGISQDEPPQDAPWLIKMDKFVDGQDHAGLEEFVIRSNNTRSSLNEAVALELLEFSGLASQDAIATRFSVNGSEAVLRLSIEHPDDEWMKENFDASGALYKAESSGDYSYRGDDPASYDDVFDQEAGKKNADLSPLIAFLKFINQAEDSTFKSQLPLLLDTDSFAVYLAMQDLLNNFDDIDGPGNNSYLYYDTVTGRFTVVPWDYNLAFGTQQGGGGAGGGFMPGGDLPNQGDTLPPTQGQLPDGQMPQTGGGRNPMTGDGNFPTDGNFPGNGNNPGQGGGFGGGSNILVQRFLADEEWNALYAQKLVSLRASLYSSGTAADILDVWRATVGQTGLVDDSVLDAESLAISIYFQ